MEALTGSQKPWRCWQEAGSHGGASRMPEVMEALAGPEAMEAVAGLELKV